jgi:uncharacterized protein YoxC
MRSKKIPKEKAKDLEEKIRKIDLLGKALSSDLNIVEELKQELIKKFPHLDHWIQSKESDINQLKQISRDLGFEILDSVSRREEIVEKAGLKTAYWM